jgi:type I restriction enzyme S subunit
MPEDWDFDELTNHAKIIAGQSPESTYYNSLGEGMPFLQGIKTFGNLYPTYDTWTTRITKLAKKDSVLLSVRAPVGEVNIADKDICIGRGLMSIEGEDNRFIYYLFKAFNDYVINKEKGTVYGSITLEDVKRIKFPFSPLTEQRAIAKILSDLDEKIELNQKMNKTLEAIGQAIFKHWFVDFEFPNDEGKPYKSSGGEMVFNEEIGKEIPMGWRVGFLGDNVLSNISRPGIYKFEGEKIYLDTASVQKTAIVEFNTKITFEQRPSRANMQPKPGTIWFAKMKDSKKILYFDDYSEYAISNFILSTGFAGLDVKKYALYYIWSFISRDEFELEKDNLCNGTTMQAINNENITKIKLLIPSKDILEKFNIITKPIYQKSYYNWLQNLSLSQIRDSLLPKLMSGEIRVKDAF